MQRRWTSLVVVVLLFISTCLAPANTTSPGSLAGRPSRFFGFASGYTLGFEEFWQAVHDDARWQAWWRLFQQDIRRMQDLRVGWVLWWVVWYEVEPERGHFQHFGRLHAVVDELAKHHIELVMGFHSAPCWNWDRPPDCQQQQDTPPNPARLDEYQESLGRVVREFRAQVRYWKILEEPNVMFYGDLPVQEQAARYAQVLRAAHTVVKAVDPSIQVILGGIHVDALSGPDAHYLEYTRYLVRNLEALSPRTLFDIVAMHQHRFPYGPYEINPYTGRTMAQEIDDLLAIFDRSGVYRNKKLWITNLSWPAIGNVDRLQDGIVSEEKQAVFLRQAYEVMNAPTRAARIERWGWVDLRDPDFPLTPEFERYYGLLRYDAATKSWVKKPAYDAMKNLPRHGE